MKHADTQCFKYILRSPLFASFAKHHKILIRDEKRDDKTSRHDTEKRVWDE